MHAHPYAHTHTHPRADRWAAALGLRFLRSVLYPLEAILSAILFFKTVPGVARTLVEWPCCRGQKKRTRFLTRVEEIEASHMTPTQLSASVHSRGSFGQSSPAPYVRFTEDFEYDQADTITLGDLGTEHWSLVSGGSSGI